MTSRPLLDVVEVLEPVAQESLIEQASRWPRHSVRRLALGLIAARQGPEAAHAIAERDPHTSIRNTSTEDAAGPRTLF